jgi:hypothetical protein
VETQFTARQIKLEHAAEALIIERGNRIPVRSEARVPETQYVPPRAAVDKLSDLFQRGASEAQRALHGLAFVRGETILGAQISDTRVACVKLRADTSQIATDTIGYV